MTSGVFGAADPHSITINRSERTRREVTQSAITDMAESLKARGQIHPIVITRDFVLVAGETRLEGAKAAGLTQITYQFVDSLDERELLALEIEENIKRVDLPWQDRVDALRRYHELRLEENPGWTQAETAKAIGLNQGLVSQYMGVAKEIAAGNTKLAGQRKLSVAVNMAGRITSRRREDELAQVAGPVPPQPPSPIVVADFNEWAPAYADQPFNLIHCDFPYGIGFDSPKFGQYDTEGSYADGPEVYWSLIDTLCTSKERLLGGSGHVLFWFSMKLYQPTLDRLRQDFLVNEFPLIWHKSDNKGTLSDASRWPRRIYETAFLCSHGDRKIIQAVGNAWSGPTVKETDHISEKPVDMLCHFFRMFVDERTRLLDPTAGSGSSLRAADKLGAGRVLGLEVNEEFAADAAKAWSARK